MAHLSGYSKYKALTLTGGASGAQTDYQLKLAVSYEAAMQGDFDDLRFTQSDGTTLVDAWAEVIVTDTSATVWVEFPTTPANTVEQIYRMYYGNAGAASDWDIEATFLLGDDFPGASIDTNKWDVKLNTGAAGGSVSVTNSEVTLDNDDMIISKSAWGYDHAVTFKSKADEQDTCFSAFALTKLFGWDAMLGINNTDATYPNDFDRFTCPAAKDSGNYTSPSLDGHSDFRNTYHRYTITRKSGEAKYYQNDILLYTQTNATYLPTSNLHAAVAAWDSSQESTLICDWAFVRKFVANPPTYAFGAEQSVPTGNPYWYYNLLKRRN